MLVTRRVPIAFIEANFASSTKSNEILQSHGGWLSRDPDLRSNLEKGSVAINRPPMVVNIQCLVGYKESCPSPDKKTLKRKGNTASHVIALIASEEAANISSDHFVNVRFISKYDETPSHRLMP